MKNVVAYIADWGFHRDLTQEQAKRLTDVRYAFGLIKDGEIDASGLHETERLTRHMALYPHIRWVLSVGGWGAGGFSEAVSTADGREKLALSALRIVREYGFNGIDWDWEYPTSTAADIAASPNDNVNVTELLTLTRTKLDALTAQTGRRYIQSIAVGAGDDRAHDYIWEKAAPALDNVGLMTYDMGMGGRAAHVANLYHTKNASFSAEQSVAAFVKAGVPREKLLIGCAFYFHGYEGDFGQESPFLKPYEKSVRGGAYGQVADKLPSMTRWWDESAAAAAFCDGRLFLTGDDPQSLSEKRRYVEREGLGGVIIWELNHDPDCVLLKELA